MHDGASVAHSESPRQMPTGKSVAPLTRRHVPIRSASNQYFGEDIICRTLQFKRRLVTVKLGDTKIMKTCVSAPDDLFRQAEEAARRLRMSRNELFSTAISEFLRREESNAITECLNEVYSRRPAKVDAGLHRAQRRSLDIDSW